MTSSSPSGTEVPLVSIITPSYNHAQFIDATIRSVVEQDYPNLEYIIIDGGSTDGSQEIIRSWAERFPARLVYWVSEPDRGQTDAINKGFSRARGEILAWLNSDDTYQPEAVSRAAQYLIEHPKVGLVYGDANLIDQAGEIIGKFPARQTDYRRLRRGYVHIPQQAAFFRTDLWHKVGPLDPTFYFAMDYDLWVRLASQAPIHYVAQPWANFRLHSQGKSVVADDRCWPEMLRVHYREGGSRYSWLVIKARLRPIIYGWLPMETRLRLRHFLPFL